MPRIVRCPYYGPRDLARAVGQHERTVRRFLRERYPLHVGWWHLTRAEYLQLLRELRRPAVRRRYGNRRHRR